MEGERTSADPSAEDVVVMPLPRMDLKTVGLAGVKAAREELDKARSRAIRNRKAKP